MCFLWEGGLGLGGVRAVPSLVGGIPPPSPPAPLGGRGDGVVGEKRGRGIVPGEEDPRADSRGRGKGWGGREACEVDKLGGLARVHLREESHLRHDSLQA